jgi:hypothetical protein
MELSASTIDCSKTWFYVFQLLLPKEVYIILILNEGL